MALFAPQNRTTSDRNRRLYAAFELAHTAVDAAAALFFLIGSVMFFFDALKTPATWCFVVGSVLFAVKPVLRVTREIRLAAEGDVGDLAKRDKS